MFKWDFIVYLLTYSAVNTQCIQNYKRFRLAVLQLSCSQIPISGGDSEYLMNTYI